MSFTLERIKPKRRKEEASFQVHLVRVLRDRLENTVVFAVPNGGSRNVVEAANLKQQGVLAGVPDLVLIHCGRAFGLECKAEGGDLSKSQREVFPILRQAGMRVEVVRTVSEALERCGEFGIPIKAAEQWDVHTLFKTESNRRPGSTWKA